MAEMDQNHFFCRNKAEGKGCDAPNLLYDEVNLLQRLADFRWKEFFGDEKHDAERAAAAAEVELLAQVIATEKGIIENLTKAVDDALLAGKGRNDIAYIRANKLLPEKLDNLKRRRNSAEARSRRLRQAQRVQPMDARHQSDVCDRHCVREGFSGHLQT